MYVHWSYGTLIYYWNNYKLSASFINFDTLGWWNLFFKINKYCIFVDFKHLTYFKLWEGKLNLYSVLIIMSTSFTNVHCKALFTLVEPRCALFMQDALKFMIISEDVEHYITLSLKHKKCNKAMDFFVDYIDIHVLLMHQFAYLFYGICSFLFHFDELNYSKIVQMHMKEGPNT